MGHPIDEQQGQNDAGAIPKGRPLRLAEMPAHLRAEVEDLKRREDEELLVALGLKEPTKPNTMRTELSQQELAEACQRGTTVDEESVFDHDRMQGVGFGNLGDRHIPGSIKAAKGVTVFEGSHETLHLETSASNGEPVRAHSYASDSHGLRPVSKERKKEKKSNGKFGLEMLRKWAWLKLTTFLACMLQKRNRKRIRIKRKNTSMSASGRVHRLLSAYVTMRRQNHTRCERIAMSRNWTFVRGRWQRYTHL